MSVDCGPLPEVHPRDDAIREAKKELSQHIEDVRLWHSLTSAELMFVITETMSEISRSLIALERRKRT
jgi:hypothetical protein